MSARRTEPAAQRATSRGLLSSATTAEEDIATLNELSQYSHATYPYTPVCFPPMLVGYDTAPNRVQWESTYEHDVGGHWAKGNMKLYSEWQTAALGTNAAGDKHTHRLGLFATETEPWVGKKGGMWMHQEWHAWGACLYPDGDGKGKILVIFDSNVANIMESAAWTKPGPPDSENDLEQKQRTLLTYLRKERKLNISQIWYGGEGNTAQGLCFPLTYDWCARVVNNQGLPTEEEKLRELGYYRLTRKTGARGKAPTDRKPYVKKTDGGDGRGGKPGDEDQAGSGRYGLRSQS